MALNEFSDAVDAPVSNVIAESWDEKFRDYTNLNGAVVGSPTANLFWIVPASADN